MPAEAAEQRPQVRLFCVGRLWICQAVISFSTLLLGIAVIFRARISLQVLPISVYACSPSLSTVGGAKREQVSSGNSVLLAHSGPGFVTQRSEAGSVGPLGFNAG